MTERKHIANFEGDLFERQTRWSGKDTLWWQHIINRIMTSYSQALRVTNCIQQDRILAEDLIYDVTDLSRDLPLAIFEGSRRKEDFHKVLKRAHELLRVVDTVKQASYPLVWSEFQYSVKILSNLLLLSISYHCRILLDSFSHFHAIYWINTHQNRTREDEFKTGYLLVKDMANTLVSVHDQFNVHCLSNGEQEDMMGLLLPSILRLNAISTQNSDESSEDSIERWPRRCWRELGCPLMKMATSIMEPNGSSATRCISQRRISRAYILSVIESLTCVSHEDIETKSCRENLLVQLEQWLSRHSFKANVIHSQEPTALTEMASKKRDACNGTDFPSVIDHCYLDISTIFEQSFGLTFPAVNLFWSTNAGAETDGTGEIEQALTLVKSKSELQDFISLLVRKILLSSPSSGKPNDDLDVTPLAGTVQTSREAAHVLLPILYVLLTRDNISLISRSDLIAICKSLLITPHDNEVVYRTIEMLFRLLVQIAHTHCAANELIIHDFVGLIDCTSQVISMHPSPSLHIMKGMLFAFRQMAISYSHDECLWSQLTRGPHFLSAIVRATPWQTLHAPVMQILWVLTRNPVNQRCVARHPGVLASMIRIARESPSTDSSLALPATVITVEAWKNRIMKLAETL